MGDIDHHRDFSECKKQRKSRRARHNGQKQANQARNNNHISNDNDNRTNGFTSDDSKSITSTTTSNSSSNSNNSGHNNNNSSSQRCWDWMMVGGTNHYAKNRSAFITYRRAPCKVNGRTRVLGIGTVKLNLERSPQDPSTYTLLLHDVLHIPDAVCNGISINPGFMGSGNYEISWRDKRIYDADTEEPCWYARAFHHDGLMRCVLAGDPRGQTFLEKDGKYMLSVNASEEELGVLGRRVENRSLL